MQVTTLYRTVVERPAGEVRRLLAEAGVVAVTITGAPGTGKTALIEGTVQRLSGPIRVGVVVANLAAAREASRLRHGCQQVVAVETASLGPVQLRDVLDRIDLDSIDLLLIENGGLGIPSTPLDLGETARVAVFSVGGGDGKAAELPQLVAGADAVVLNKADLLFHVPFDCAQFAADVKALNVDAPLLKVASLDGRGLRVWVEWLLRHAPPVARGVRGQGGDCEPECYLG